MVIGIGYFGVPNLEGILLLVGMTAVSTFIFFWRG
jgi:hypothetical protein